MKIKATQDFLHGTKRHKEGRTYTVEDGLGTYFVMNGWAASDEVSADGTPPGEVDLEVHDASHDQNSEVK